jgi:hypothetical protein
MLLPCSEAQIREAADSAEIHTRKAEDVLVLLAAKNHTDAEVAR